jgi:hypothetical protein
MSAVHAATAPTVRIITTARRRIVGTVGHLNALEAN